MQYNRIANSNREASRGPYDSASGCGDNWERDVGEVSHLNEINRNVVYAMSQINFEIFGKFSEYFVGTLIYRLQGGTIRVNSYIDVGCSR